MAHDGGTTTIRTTEIVSTWPKGSFAENLAIDAAGTVFVTLHTDRTIVRVDPASGRAETFATLDGPVTGLAFDARGALIVSGGTPGQSPGLVWRVAPDGSATRIAEIADAAFLNGVTPLDERFLIADSLGGIIFAVDPSGAVERWLASPMLMPPAGSKAPGANGVKLFGKAVTISVTGADRLVRAPVEHGRPGAISVVAEDLRADDFAFDAGGSLYIATHPERSLVRLAPDGARTTLATAADGMTGATAVAFGRRPDDSDCVYVTTTGGTWTVPDAELEEAKLVRVRVGARGAPLSGGA